MGNLGMSVPFFLFTRYFPSLFSDICVFSLFGRPCVWLSLYRLMRPFYWIIRSVRVVHFASLQGCSVLAYFYKLLVLYQYCLSKAVVYKSITFNVIEDLNESRCFILLKYWHLSLICTIIYNLIIFRIYRESINNINSHQLHMRKV